MTRTPSCAAPAMPLQVVKSLPMKSPREKRDMLEAARNAMTGYTAVVLGIVCFILALMLLMAAVRFGVGLSIAANPTTTSQTQTVFVGSRP